MFKRFLAPLFVLALAGCAHPQLTTSSTQSTTPVAVETSHVYSGESWSITVPSSMMRQTPASGEEDTFDALDRKRLMTMYIQIQPTSFTLDQAAAQFAMHLASRGIDIQSMEPATWLDKSGLTIVATKEVASGVIHFYSWATVINGHGYHFGCIAMPKADLAAAEQTCKAAAASVKFKFSPATN